MLDLTPKKLVTDYLLQSVNFDKATTLADRIYELDDAFETIPDNVLEAFEEISSHELWEIIGKVATEGKKRSKQGLK